MTFDIKLYGEPCLRRVSEPVETFDHKNLQKLRKNMDRIMRRYGGIGLAAPQIGQNLRCILIDLSPNGERLYSQLIVDGVSSTGSWPHPSAGPLQPAMENRLDLQLPTPDPAVDGAITRPIRFPLFMINPEILLRSMEASLDSEGCLSLPHCSAQVLRPDRIRVQYFDLDRERHQIETDGYFARCIQHEIDHLDGILYVDRIGEEERQKLLKTFEVSRQQS